MRRSREVTEAPLMATEWARDGYSATSGMPAGTDFGNFDVRLSDSGIPKLQIETRAVRSLLGKTPVDVGFSSDFQHPTLFSTPH